MRFIFFLALLFPAIVNAQLADPTKKALRILTLGDSNGSFPYSWPVQLQKALPEAEVFNISRGGRTIGFINNGDSSLNSLMVIDENLRKAVDHAKGQAYDFIVLDLGTNDGKAVFANRQKQVHRNLDQLIKTIKNYKDPVISNAKIIVIAPTPYGSKAEATEKYKGGNARVKQMSKCFRKVARRNDCFFVDGFHTPGLDIETMTADGLHLNEEGSKRLIAPVVDIILANSK